jgi:hypothetical protein
MGNLNKNKNIKEVVAICDQLDGAVTKCDLKNINIESLIHIVRGQKVMLDSDLAMLYGVTTSRLNEQVKRNINRFPDDFMFQLTKEEWSALRSQFAILEDLKSQKAISNSEDEEMNERLTSQIAILKNGRGQHRKFLPYAFTRNGIGMLSSVLRSETDTKVNQIITTIEKRLPEQLPEQVFATGCVWDGAVTKMEVSPELILGLIK